MPASYLGATNWFPILHHCWTVGALLKTFRSGICELLRRCFGIGAGKCGHGNPRSHQQDGTQVLCPAPRKASAQVYLAAAACGAGDWCQSKHLEIDSQSKFVGFSLRQAFALRVCPTNYLTAFFPPSQQTNQIDSGKKMRHGHWRHKFADGS